MDTCKIFIASSAELKQDRDEFRQLLSLVNDRYHYKGVYLELQQWEYFFDGVSEDSKQGDYNEKLKVCDIVVCLFYTKAGKYTQLEFDTALKQFHDAGKPIIYTYFKEPENTVNALVVDASLNEFKERLASLGHFYTRYKSTEDLHLQFKMQLDLLADKGLFTLQQEIKAQTKDAVAKYVNNIQGNNNVINESGTVNQTTLNTGNQQAEKIVNIGSNVGDLNF